MIGDVAKVTYTPDGLLNAVKEATTPGEFTYDGFILDNTKTSDKTYIKLTADSLDGAPYILTIFKLDEESDPFVSVDNSGYINSTLVKEDGNEKLMYVWAVDDDAKTASVTLTTAVTNGQVQIENGNVYSYTTTEDVTLNFNDKGYMDIALKVTTTLGAVNEYTLRIYKKTADSRLALLLISLSTSRQV